MSASRRFCRRCGFKRQRVTKILDEYNEITGEKETETFYQCINLKCKAGKINMCESLLKYGKHKYSWIPFLKHKCKTCPDEYYDYNY